MYQRFIQNDIENWIGKHKVLILYGARQVGKSTILRMLKEHHESMIILNAENTIVQEILVSNDLQRIKFLFGNNRIVAIDEAQKIENIGSILKYIFDNLNKDIQVIATGSSSFELSNKLTEPLTGRNIKFTVYPFSLGEILASKSNDWVIENLNNLLIFGQYPELIDFEIQDKIRILENLSIDYLFQDILKLDNLLNANLLTKLLKAVAYQIGSELSFLELAQLLGISPQTVQNYLDLLEKSFVLISLNSINKNMRNEIKKNKKYYFVDLGLRNALISNFSAIENRNDKGALWENFCIVERIKLHSTAIRRPNLYFWRTYDKAEIDLVEELDGNFNLFEFKFKNKKIVKFPQSFLSNYPVGSQKVITTDNLYELLQ